MEEFIFADMDQLTRRIEKLEVSSKKPTPNKENDLKELDLLRRCLKALETGNPVEDVPANEQDQIRTQLSMAILAVISQSLLPKIGGGRVAAHEIMINNPAIANLIRENKIAQIYSQMQLNQGVTGMQTMNQVLAEYVRRHMIDKETAMAYTTKPEELRKLIGV
jgi:twitching motility protein PilT